jgi:phage repressor protein C with HTH and peptisase S24 domain
MNKAVMLDAIKEYLTFKKNSDLAVFLGVTPQAVSNWYSRNTFDAELIYTKCEFVNPDWLLTGKGPMLKTKEKAKEEKVKEEKPPSINIKHLEKSDTYATIPIVDVSAAAGHGFFNPDYTEQIGEITIPTQMLSKKSGNYYCGYVSGESMEPTLLNKDYIIFKYLSMEEWVYIPNNSICFLVDRSGISYVKRIVNRLSSKGYLLCLSDNIDKINYGDFSLYEDDISNIYLVEWKFSNNLSNINEYYYSRLHVLEERVGKLEKGI